MFSTTGEELARRLRKFLGNGWQPIETAPEAGPFLVWGGTWQGEVNGPEPLAVPCVVAPCGARYDVVGTDAYAAWVVGPTHWMPLPKAPDA